MKQLFLFLALTITTLNAYAGIIKTNFSDIELDPDSTKIRLDTYLPNPGINNGIIGTIAQDVFTSAGIGFIRDGSYADGTSGQVTSDIHVAGDPRTWTFVDPTNTMIKTRVRQLGFYYGSLQDTVTASFYDINDALIESFTLAKSISGTSVGFDAGSSIIHKVVFTQSGSDDWLLGSFTQDNSINDIVFTNGASQVSEVPEPSTFAFLLLGIAAIGFRKFKQQF